MVCVCVYGEGWRGGGAGGGDVKQCIRNCNTISSERFHECLCVLHVGWRMERDLLRCSFCWYTVCTCMYPSKLYLLFGVQLWIFLSNNFCGNAFDFIDKWRNRCSGNMLSELSHRL